jgi:arsenate reductase
MAAAEAARRKVLFLCTHNSARSKMAEGLLRGLAGDSFEAFSAGTEATRVRQEAISVMAEIGVDISAQESKTLERYLASPLGLVVTVCDDANEACPVFPGARDRLHWWSFPVPSRVEGEGRLRAFRDVRDEIRVRIEGELIEAQG